MRKITQEAVEAFDNSYSYKNGNTKETVDELEVRLYLFGNVIARKIRANCKVEISSCGYTTATTRERLNGLLARYNYNLGRVFIKDFAFYYENSEKTILSLDESYITIS